MKRVYVVHDGTPVLLALPLREGDAARFITATTKIAKVLSKSQLVYEPTNAFEDKSLTDAIAVTQRCQQLASPHFEKLLTVVSQDVLGDAATQRMMVFEDKHYLLVVDAHQVDTKLS